MFYYESFDDFEFGFHGDVPDMLCLSRNEELSQRQLRTEIFRLGSVTRPSQVYAQIDECFRRGLLDEVNGQVGKDRILVITPKGQSIIDRLNGSC